LPTLARINIYPIKSLDGLAVELSRAIAGAGLEHDRRFALRSADGKFVNANRTARMHTVRARFEVASRTAEFEFPDEPRSLAGSLDADRAAIEQRLSAHLGRAVTLDENSAAGFPDDTDAPGPTIVASATLAAVAGWFGLEVDEVRRRFRANLEIDGVEAFWEDRLYAAQGQGARVAIGEATLEGVNPCRRCVVPTRNPNDGAPTDDFAKALAERRLAHLPPWAARNRFDDTAYRLTTNTKVIVGGLLRTGDRVTMSA